MPKIIELTVEIDVQRVSCPGVWLCQDGRVSLTVFALGTSYQTCLLPPMFPLMFKDIFYFRKRFQESCALNNICCLLKDETIYCELVQWCEDCSTDECTILAQYLGALNDVLFPPNMCSSDGVDLLMRRSKVFPGILSPKIEIATKVRIDEVWNQCGVPLKAPACHCSKDDAFRQRQVCHTPLYHRNRCYKTAPLGGRSRSRSNESRSWCSLPKVQIPEPQVNCKCPSPITMQSPCSQPKRSVRRPRSATRARPCPQYNVYNVDTSSMSDAWARNCMRNNVNCDDMRSESARIDTDPLYTPNEDRMQKILLESRYIEDQPKYKIKKMCKPKITPCVCEICKRYHELFHAYRP